MKSFLVIAIYSLFVLVGCVSIDKSAVQARSGAPQSAQVAMHDMPYQSDVPVFLVAVEPVRFASSVSETTFSGMSRTAQSGQTELSSQVSSKGTTQGGVATSLDINQYNQHQKGTASGTVPPSRQTGQIGDAVIRPEEVSYSPTAATSDPELESGKSMTVTRGGVKSSLGQSTEENRQSGGKATGSSRSQTAYRSTIVNKNYGSEVQAGRIVSQLTSALAAIGNISIVHLAALQPAGNGTFRYGGKVSSNESGPYLIRAVITEYEARVEEDKSKVKIPLFFGTSHNILKGVVGLDVAVVDGRSGRIVASVPAQGTFTQEEKKANVGILTDIFEQSSMARSVMDQALRVALNDAAVRIFESLRSKANAGTKPSQEKAPM